MSAASRNDIIQQFVPLLQRGQLKRAAQLLRSRLETDPSWLQARQELAKLLTSQEQYDEALDVLREAPRHHPRETTAWSALAIALLNRGHPDQAIRHLTRAIILDPGALLAHEALVNTGERNQTDTARTARALERSIILAPISPRARLAFARHWLARRRYLSDVARQTKRALILDPGSQEAAFLQGAVNVAEMSSAIAVRYFRWARTAAPDNPTVCYHLGNSAFLAADFDLAENAVQDALRFGSPEARARFLLGRTHRARGRFADAAREFDRAVELDPELAEPRRMAEWTVTMEHFQA